MGLSTSNHLTSMDLEIIEISWSFVKDKQILGLKTMIRYNSFFKYLIFSFLFFSLN